MQRLIDANALVKKAYWHGEHPTVDRLFAEGVDAVEALNRQGMLRVRVYESEQEIFTTQDIVEIKCCPNCGAKMGLEG